MKQNKKLRKSIDFLVDQIRLILGDDGVNSDDFFRMNEDGDVEIEFPCDCDQNELILDKDDFIKQTNEFKNAEYSLNNNLIKINGEDHKFYLIGSDEYLAHQHFEIKEPFEATYENIKLSIVYDRSFLFGLIALKLESFDTDYFSPLNYSLAIKVENSNLNESDESLLIESYRFELAANYEMLIYANPYEEIDPLFNYEEEEEYKSDESETSKSRVRSLFPFNEGMRMLLVADSINDSEFKFLSLYKTIEYFSPIALKVDVLKKLMSKIDSPDALNPNSNYLNSIIELVSAYEYNKKDKELIKNVIRNCVDIEGIKNEFPEFLKNHVNPESITYKKKSEIDKGASKVGEILYATRNMLAHAKSNYTLSGLECPKQELDTLNKFTRKIVIQVIKWYGRLPSHLR